MALFYPIDQGLHTKCFKTYPLYEFIKRSNIKFSAEREKISILDMCLRIYFPKEIIDNIVFYIIIGALKNRYAIP